MGKGARNRAKRVKETAQVAHQDAVREAIGELLGVQTFEEYSAILERRPELGTAAAADEMKRASRAPGFGPLFARAAVLLEGTRGGDATAAWAAHREAVAATQGHNTDTLEAIQAEIDTAQNAGDHSRVLELVDRALPVANEIGFGASVCELLHHRGLALYNVGTIDRADELDAAIEAFQTALEVADRGEQAASILMHLGLAFAERIYGDRADNVEQAISVLRDALAELGGSDDELRAMVLTNLSVLLVRSERDDRSAVAREAADLCREALLIRSVQRNADDWAYSQLNLGEALLELAELGEVAAAEVRAAFQAVLDHAPDIPNQMLVGGAHHALGRMDLASTLLSPEDLLEAHAADTLEEGPDETGPLLRAASDHLRAARDLITNNPIRRARVLRDLSTVLAELGEQDEAIAALREALTVLRPTTAPHACRDAASDLGSLLAEREDWRGAAEAMRDAVEAAELTFHARLDMSSREREARGTGNLHRWAAYAIARAGDAADAAVVLDAGRSREIGRRLGSDTSLAGVPAQLRDDYRAAVQALAISPLGSDSTGASRHLQEVIAAIRLLPGHERFGAGPRLSELAQALEPEWPLIYVNPAPAGTLLLALWPEGDERSPTVEATFVETTSNDVFMRLIAGDSADPNIPLDDGASYLAGVSSNVEPEQLTAALDQLLPWMGEAVGRPIAAVLRARGATSATLIVCGPLGLAPLHAAPWESESGPCCLADCFDIRFAPSAVVCGAALHRAARERPAHLVALADPQGDLPAARPEVEEISALFGSANADVAVGRQADIKFLRRHAARATHLHLACHARGGVFDATEAAVMLASGALSAIELTAVAQLDARLVVISACESALSSIADLPDEVVSIATAMLASGSACAIASLWPVDDLATALLMTRLYQEMLVSGCRPPEALRRAQLWLRALSEDEEQRFLDRHPALAAEFERRMRSGRGAPGRRAEGVADVGPGIIRPYAHPDYWAPFVAIGV